ncbi:MAG: Glyceraldehyde-3-phosphate dehydrogenase [candidate division TM6 bacterium GW2011_GWE2_31_21]|nr:MAG: Glyceraldehyde-3-phosphate dehydrogenase [candidate division TM6 bacterium GW2011_GWE2_31_21]KKP53700.1 MAG: Glyceraldehyde-3-phosphate dehydrogenase [candidate division TM6 bacterium GW2011_GWF2_33_332]
MANIAISGFGRIGKAFLRALIADESVHKKINVVAINIGPAKPEMVAFLFKYDSIMGIFPGNVEYKNGFLHIDDYKIKIIAETDPLKIDWKSLDVDWVVESSGHFTSREKAELHLKAGAKKILITAPSTGEDITIIPGVNDSSYDAKKHSIVSLGSCTTNCFAPIVKVIKENFKLKCGLMTTVHAYTNDQVLLDVEHKDPRRARAAAQNIIPTKTGAEKVIVKIYPELEGKLQAVALRVPVPKVSIVDFSFETGDSLTTEVINNAFKKAAESDLKNILQYTEEPLVSSDFSNNPHSCIIDGLITKAAGNMGKVFGWYDNEWGYCERLKDFLKNS